MATDIMAHPLRRPRSAPAGCDLGGVSQTRAGGLRLQLSGFVLVAPQSPLEVDLESGDGDEVGPAFSVAEVVEGLVAEPGAGTRLLRQQRKPRSQGHRPLGRFLRIRNMSHEERIAHERG